MAASGSSQKCRGGPSRSRSQRFYRVAISSARFRERPSGLRWSGPCMVPSIPPVLTGMVCMLSPTFVNIMRMCFWMKTLPVHSVSLYAPSVTPTIRPRVCGPTPADAMVLPNVPTLGGSVIVGAMVLVGEGIRLLRVTLLSQRMPQLVSHGPHPCLS